MKPVMQTIFTVDVERGVYGDCFRACIASIFDVALDDVPHFMLLGKDAHPESGPLGNGQSAWWFYLRDWLRDRDLTFFDLPYEGNSAEFFSAIGYYALTGRSPRGEWNHCVVARGTEIVHDPHPAGGGVTDRQYVGVFARRFVTDNPAFDALTENWPRWPDGERVSQQTFDSLRDSVRSLESLLGGSR